jgi:DNA-binding MarR family transcriptional regulator
MQKLQPTVYPDVIAEMADTCVLMRTRLLSRVVTALYDDALRPHGLNAPQFALLVVIGRFHQQERSTLTRNLQILQAEGWIDEVAGQARGRARPVVLSPSGIALLHAVDPAWRTAQAQVKNMLGEEGTCALTTLADGLPFSKAIP